MKWKGGRLEGFLWKASKVSLRVIEKCYFICYSAYIQNLEWNTYFPQEPLFQKYFETNLLNLKIACFFRVLNPPVRERIIIIKKNQNQTSAYKYVLRFFSFPKMLCCFVMLALPTSLP